MRTGVAQSPAVGANLAGTVSNADCRITVGGDTYTSQDGGRLMEIVSDEQVWGGQYIILLDNSDDALDAKAYEGLTLTMYFGFIGITGSNLANLYVEKQEFISKEGKLLLSLTCKDNLVKISLHKGAVGSSYWNYLWQSPTELAKVRLPVSGKALPAALVAAITAQYDKTALQIIQTVVTATLGCSLTTNADPYMTSEKPLVYAPDAREVIAQALRSTDSYILCSGSGFKIIQPAATGVIYSFNTANLFFNDTQERAATIPNKIVFHGITAANALISTGAAHGKDAASIALLGEISEHNDYDYASRENSKTQAIVDSKANRRIAKLQLMLGSGTLVAPMHCSLELFDKVSVVDTRYTPTKTITGYVWAIKREYGRGVYRITIQLGGVEKGYSPEGIPDFSPGPSTPVTPKIPDIFVVPLGMQAYVAAIVFTSVDWDTVSWTAGTIKTSDGSTQAINAGTKDLLNDNPYYCYWVWGSPTLVWTQNSLDISGDERGLCAVAKRGADATDMAYVANHFMDSILINRQAVMDNLVTELKLAASAVTEAKIAVAAVTELKLGNLAVTAAKLANAAVEEAKIATNAVTEIKINTGAITEAKIAASAVVESKIAANAVSEAKIVASAVTSGKLAAQSVIAGKIAALSIAAGDIAADAIEASKIKAGAVVAGKIAALSIVAGDIATDAIEASKIKADAITATKIQAGAVVAGKIAALSIAAGDIAANAIIAAKIQAGAVEADKIATNAITAVKIQAGAVIAEKIQANAVTAEKIFAGAITTVKLDAFAVDATKIAANSISADKLAATIILASIIWAGNNKVKLSSAGIQQYGQNYKLYDTSGNYIADIYSDANGLIILAGSNKNISITNSGTGQINITSGSNGIYLNGVTYRNGALYIGQCLPWEANVSYLGAANRKWHTVYRVNESGCDLPSSNSGIEVMKKIKNPKVTDGKYGNRHYFKDSDMPDEVKFVGKKEDGSDAEPEIEFTRLMGVTTQTVRELIDKVEALEAEVVKLKGGK